MPKVPNIRRLHIFAISQKKRGDEVYFLPVDKHKILLVDSITLGVRSQTCTSTQNNKLAISLRYLKENVKDEVYFLPVDKHQSSLQIILDACGQGAQITQNNKFTISLQYLKKEVSGVVDCR